MNPTRCLTTLTLTFGLLLFCLTNTTLAADRWVVFPFENVSSKPEYNWLGEGMAILLSDLLSVPGVEVITPDDRRLAYRKLSFTESSILSRASAIRVAQEIEADRLVVGNYKVSGAVEKEQVHVTLWLIDVGAGKFAQNSMEAAAPLADVVELQSILAWDVLSNLMPTLTLSRQQLQSRVRGVPLQSFALYVKAVLVQDISKREKLLRAALKQLSSGATFSLAAYEIGKTYFGQGKYAEAINWFSQIKLGEMMYADAQFQLGLSLYSQEILDKAVSVYTDLLPRFPTVGVYTNLALVELKRREFDKALEHLRVALSADDDNPDLWFNLGYALWLKGDYEAAIEKLRDEVIRRRNNDGDAHYLIAKCYAQLGRQGAATGALDQAKQYQPKVEQWERGKKHPMLARLVKKLDRAELVRPN